MKYAAINFCCYGACVVDNRHTITPDGQPTDSLKILTGNDNYYHYSICVYFIYKYMLGGDVVSNIVVNVTRYTSCNDHKT